MSNLEDVERSEPVSLTDAKESFKSKRETFLQKRRVPGKPILNSDFSVHRATIWKAGEITHKPEV